MIVTVRHVFGLARGGDSRDPIRLELPREARGAGTLIVGIPR
ncbi:MAG: hypothetical protein ACRELA_04395 [Candidatus Rokuibacteriota bacterium]